MPPMPDSPKATATGANRREHYRVEYPVADRPAFAAGSLKGQVSDCSETGVRAMLTGVGIDAVLPLVGDEIAATIRFARSEALEVVGTVIRCDTRVIVMRLDKVGIPFGRIIREQWRLRALYPWRQGA